MNKHGLVLTANRLHCKSDTELSSVFSYTMSSLTWPQTQPWWVMTFQRH